MEQQMLWFECSWFPEHSLNSWTHVAKCLGIGGKCGTGWAERRLLYLDVEAAKERIKGNKRLVSLLEKADGAGMVGGNRGKPRPLCVTNVVALRPVPWRIA